MASSVFYRPFFYEPESVRASYHHSLLFNFTNRDTTLPFHDIYKFPKKKNPKNYVEVLEKKTQKNSPDNMYQYNSRWSTGTSDGVSKTDTCPGLSVNGSETVANRCPPSAKEADLSGPMWLYTTSSLPVCTSHMRAEASADADTIRVESPDT